MNNDLISRSALKATFENLASDDYNVPIWYQQTVFETIDNAPTVCNDNYAMGYQDGVKKVLSERPQGKWIMNKTSARGRNYTCTNCEKISRNKFDYCPNCGAEMREAENE